MIAFVLLFLITLFVAYANGANDNFKGVATLYGANVTNYKKATGQPALTPIKFRLLAGALEREGRK